MLLWSSWEYNNEILRKSLWGQDWGKIFTRLFQRHQFFCKFVLILYFFPWNSCHFNLVNNYLSCTPLQNVLLSKEEKTYYAKSPLNLKKRFLWILTLSIIFPNQVFFSIYHYWNCEKLKNIFCYKNKRINFEDFFPGSPLYCLIWLMRWRITRLMKTE